MTKEGMRYRIFSDSDDDSLFLEKKRNSRCSDRNKYCALAKFEFLILFFYFKILCATQELEMGFEKSIVRGFSPKIISACLLASS